MEFSLPQIVLVHGAWHVPAHYERYINRLEEAGYTVHCPLLPTSTTPATLSFADDVACVKSLVTSSVEQGNRVVMVLHSFGGAVGTEAVKGLALSSRLKEGKSGGVVALVYMCGFMVLAGQSANEASMPRPDPEPLMLDPEDGTTFLQIDPKQLFYNDMSNADAKWAESILVRHSMHALMNSAVTYNACMGRDIPTTYLECTEDQVMFPHWQHRQIDAVRNAGGTVEVLTYKSGHSPFLSMPDQMVEAVTKVVGSLEAP